MVKMYVLMLLLLVLIHGSYDYPVVEKHMVYGDGRRWEMPRWIDVVKFLGGGVVDIKKAASFTGGESNYELGHESEPNEVVLGVLGKRGENTLLQGKYIDDATSYNNMIQNVGQSFTHWLDWGRVAMQYENNGNGVQPQYTNQRNYAPEVEAAHASATLPYRKSKKEKGKLITAQSGNEGNPALRWFLLFISFALLTLLVVSVVAALCTRDLFDDSKNKGCTCGETKLLVNKGTSTDQDKKLKDSTHGKTSPESELKAGGKEQPKPEETPGQSGEEQNRRESKDQSKPEISAAEGGRKKNPESKDQSKAKISDAQSGQKQKPESTGQSKQEKSTA